MRLDPAERQQPRAQTGRPHRCSSQEPGAFLQGEHGPRRRGREAADSRSLPAETWVTCSPNVLTLVHSAACCAHTAPRHLDRELCSVGPAHSGGSEPLGSPAWDVEPRDPQGLGPRAEGALTEASQSRWKSTLRYALMPSTAPGRVTPRRSSAKRTTYGMVAVIHTTWGAHSVTRPHRPPATLMVCAQRGGPQTGKPGAQTVTGHQLKKCLLERDCPVPSILYVVFPGD